jgi:hypothetical protein
MNKEEPIKALETEYTHDDAVKIVELIVAKQNEKPEGQVQLEQRVRQLPSRKLLKQILLEIDKEAKELYKHESAYQITPHKSEGLLEAKEIVKRVFARQSA